jgi:hypothetical protein
MNAILSSVLGNYVDDQYYVSNDLHGALRNVGPVQFTILAGIILLATIIPRGAFSLFERERFSTRNCVTSGAPRRTVTLNAGPLLPLKMYRKGYHLRTSPM